VRLRLGRRWPRDRGETRDSQTAARDEQERTGRARADMVAHQLRRRGIRDERVLEAMATTPREAFVPNVPTSLAYDDRALPIDAGQTISQPYMVARMTELLRVEPGDRVLEIGTGSGYQAAVLARLGARVTSIERLPDLADTARERLRALGIDGVDVRLGDGSVGEPDGAPWDGIVVTAASPSIPDPLREQLEIGGRLVIPVGPREQQDLFVVERRGPHDWQEWSDGAVVFVPLIGEAGWGEAGWGDAR
jgi:protein-L-isoaspartate(D-aspartate) O-methyltransferase